MSTGFSTATPTRRCVNRKCRQPLAADEQTLHCAECHRTDPDLIRLAQEFNERQAKRAAT